MSGFGYNVLGFGGGGGVAPPEVDDKFNLTTLLAKFDGANNGVNNAFDDGSSSNHTVTASGDVTQGSFGPFARPDGGWSVDFFDQTALALPQDNADFNFGTANFTIEFFMLYKGNPSSDDSYIISFGGGSGNAGHFGLNIYNGDWRSGAFNDDLSAGTAPTDRAWHHVAQVYESNVFKLYVDGTLVSSVGSDGPFEASTAIISGYWDNSDAHCFNGLISNLRIVKGTAVYTSNFTPPTGPLTAISGTVLLACQSNHFVDNSASAHFLQTVPQANETITAKVTARGPFLTDAAYDPAVNGASAYFDGASDYLRCDTALDSFTATSSVTTIDGWFNWNGKTSSFEAIVACNATANGSNELVLSVQPDGTFEVRYAQDGVGNDHFTMGKVNKDEWNFFSVQFNNGSNAFQIFLNGSSVLTKANALNVYLSNCTFLIGTEADGANAGSLGNWWSGHFSDIRVSDNARSASVPTSPFSSDGNTKLLLNMADGQIIDNAAQNNLTLYGGAKLSTGQAKFGTTSAYFDGTAYMDTKRVLLGPYPEYFTIDFWYYGLNAGDVQQLVAQYNSGNATGVLGLNYMQSGTAGVELYLHGSTSLTIRAAAPQGQWVHVALTRSMNDFVIYINGTSGATGTSSNNIYGINTTIGGSAALTAGGYDFKGYMSDLRITKAVRYTDNFTAPLAPPPIQGQV